MTQFSVPDGLPGFDMATPGEKLAESLRILKEIQDSGRVAIRSRDLSRTHRERLSQNGFLREIMKGWYIARNPEEQSGETSPWYSSFWSFCGDYLQERFGDDWCLSPEQSILIHVGNQTVPQQLQIRSPRAGNKPTELLHNTSILDVRLKLPEQIVMHENLRLYSLPQAIMEAVPKFFRNHPTDVRSALSTLSDASSLLQQLLDGGHSKIAGRLSGAFRNIGREQIADDILETMKLAGFDVRESNPFSDKIALDLNVRLASPYAGRIRLMWQEMREPIIANFPKRTGVPPKPSAYMDHIEEVFVTDAYHSLSIEGYRVSRDLIQRIRRGDWSPETNADDRQQMDAMAARGYYQAFQAVKESVRRVLDASSGASEQSGDTTSDHVGSVAQQDHGSWYRELFAPLVNAGFLQPGSLAGYRSSRVYLRGSRHVPVSGDTVGDVMEEFFEQLSREKDDAVRVVLGHFIFVYIHPYMDGNGRMGRFMMNLMLAAGGYPWTVIPLERRDEYMEALEAASVAQDIVPFTRFLASLVSH